MKIHKDTIASELQLLIDGVNSKEQAVEEIAAYIRWRDKQLNVPDVVGQSEQLCQCDRPTVQFYDPNCKACDKKLRD